MSLRTRERNNRNHDEILSRLSRARGRQRGSDGDDCGNQLLPNSFGTFRQTANRTEAGRDGHLNVSDSPSPTLTYWSKANGAVDINNDDQVQSRRARGKQVVFVEEDVANNSASKLLYLEHFAGSRVTAVDCVEVETEESLAPSFQLIGSGNSFSRRKAGDFPKHDPQINPEAGASDSPREGGIHFRTEASWTDDLESASQLKRRSGLPPANSAEVRRLVEISRGGGGRQATGVDANRPTSFELELPSGNSSPFPRVFGQWLIDQAREALTQGGSVVEIDASLSSGGLGDHEGFDDREVKDFLSGERPVRRLRRVPEMEPELYDDGEFDYGGGYATDEEDRPLFIPAVTNSYPGAGVVGSAEKTTSKTGRKGIDGANLRKGLIVESRGDSYNSVEYESFVELLTNPTRAETSRGTSRKQAKRRFRPSHIFSFVAGLVTSAAAVYLRKRDACPYDSQSSHQTDSTNFRLFGKHSLFHSVM